MTWTYAATHLVESCNLCGSPPEQWTTIALSDRSGFRARSVACRNCGLVFITPRMSAASYAEFYGSGAYRETAGKFGHTTKKMQASQAGYARGLARWLKPHLPRSSTEVGTLLDIGGSNGIVAEELCRRFGLYGTVLEPSESEAAQAARRGLGVERGLLESWEPDERKWGLVTLLQSVDHLLDIAGSLRKIRSIMAPGGLFALDIVNFAVMLRGLRSVEKACKIDHPFGLAPVQMACYLMRAGFKIVTSATALGGRKVFFLCRHGEVVNALPDEREVAGLFRLIEEVRNARVGV